MKTYEEAMIPVFAIIASIIISIVLMLLFPSTDVPMSFANPDWSVPQTDIAQNDVSSRSQENSHMENATAAPDSV